MSNDARRTRRPWRTAAATAVTAALALTGCGFVNTGGGDDGGEDAAGTITAYTNTEQASGFEEIYAAFTDETGIEIDATSAETSELNQQLRVQLTSGTAADLIRVSPGMSSPVAAGVLGGEGELADLSDEPWAESVDAATRSLAEVDGALVGYPVSRNAITMVYNRQVFEEAGIDTPPTTWSELIDACERLQQAGKVPISAGLTGGIYLQFFIYALAATIAYGDGTELNDRMLAGDATFSSEPEWTEVFDKFVELSAYFTPDSTGVPPEQSMQALARGEAGMMIIVSAGLPQLYDYSEEGAEAFDLFPLPATDDAADTRLPMAPDFLAVNASSERIDEAKQFLEFASSPENVQAYAEKMGVLPGLENGAEVANESLEPLLPYIEEGRNAPYANYLWPNGDTQQTMLQQGLLLVTGELDVPTLLTQLDEQFAKGAA